ncbi:MAG: hypothetical protein AAB922_05920 [Patescibacteria group bacterium]
MKEKIADQIYCDWKQVDRWYCITWNTACGNKFHLKGNLQGNLKNNDYNFCPGCGRHIKEIISHD